MDINQATKAYEVWLENRIPLLKADIRIKHQRMAESAFSFFRATFYRWVQLWPKVCPELVAAPSVLAVGDLHVENFGTWRDYEGRLIWGINDFDEASPMPYTNDLVRLAASARLAILQNQLSCDPEAAADAILVGYKDCLAKSGTPFVLAEKHQWLRDIAVARLRDPATYWQKLDHWPIVRQVPAVLKTAVNHCLPEPRLSYRVVHREAGLGSLGRRRFTVLAEWRGGRIAREIKELADSAWHWRKEKIVTSIQYQQVLAHAVRVPDPFIALNKHWLIRRLAPDCSRIELGSFLKTRDELKLLRAMGWETANIHLGSKTALRRVRLDIAKRPVKWLRKAAEAMAKVTLNEWKEWANR
jgi:hypothetical protein